MLTRVRYERENLTHTRGHVITSYTFGRCVVQTAMALWHMRKSPHNRYLGSNYSYVGQQSVLRWTPCILTIAPIFGASEDLKS